MVSKCKKMFYKKINLAERLSRFVEQSMKTVQTILKQLEELESLLPHNVKQQTLLFPKEMKS